MTALDIIVLFLIGAGAIFGFMRGFVQEALALMEKHDVGRLPVVRGERLIGILTRSDLIRVLYGGRERK